MQGSKKGLRVFVAYGATLAAAVVLFILIRLVGQGMETAADPNALRPPIATARSDVNILMHILLAVAVIIVVTRAMGIAIARLGQPLVIGEVIGGILLGPSLLGRIAPSTAAYLLPPTIAPYLNVIAQLGVILYMFLVGLELDLRVLRRSGQSMIAISHASIVVPFILGSALALFLYKDLASEGISFTVFALFIGVSMSITAFPVLARILTDRRVNKTRLGTIALTCAAVDDATAWCMLAFLVSIAHAQIGSAILTIALTIVFVSVVVLFGSPLVRRILPSIERSPESGLAIILVAMLLSALATEFIGIHAIFGAFLLGVIIPHESATAAGLIRKLGGVVSVLFLPTFFAFTGMRTQIALIGGFGNWTICVVVILVACIGKFGGSFAAARLTGLNMRDASALGILMNTRGLVELIVLNIGLDLGVITPTLFAILVIMALVTTFMTTPLLGVIMGNRVWDGAPNSASLDSLDHSKA